ncbi:sensor histidine kinase [Microbacterium pseudoresistens]|uniref:histidine kinase n=1 Tax=Microbacterium pseudoresistens TaxID=640634 RepID=A0A7Y9EUM5_9MICO|nr:sensor histidine kinase [Microbacterium pseudoresistens]NYD54284.1 signal transduction histidine kinase [Microbacterium pseudoresistens]
MSAPAPVLGDAPRASAAAVADRAPFLRVPTDRDRRTDLALAAAMLVGGILSAALSSIAQLYGDAQAPLWWALVYVVIVTAPLAVRRRWPGPVAIVVAVAYFVAVTLHIPELYVGNIAMFIGLYTVGAWMAQRRAALLVRAGIILGMFLWLIIVMYRDAIGEAEKADVTAGAFSPYIAYMMLQLLLNALYFGGAYYFGERSWANAQQRAELERRTAELEREREVTAAQAVALDRVRIARELHDVVAHHVSVMGVQAGAARLIVERDPDAATAMLGGIEESSREAIRDFRHILETLRAPGGEAEEPSSTVSVSDIAGLAQASDAAGLPTAYAVIGEPSPVAPLSAVNLYRIAQEALTNARRHAGPGATADVRVRYVDDAVELDVVNTGRAVPSPRSGLGQLGMRERAAASGGTIEIGPRPSGGFRVRARLPLSQPSPRIPATTGIA